MTDTIIVLNAGSSSIKFGLYAAEGLHVLCQGSLDGVGTSMAQFSATGARAADLLAGAQLPAETDHATLTGWLLDGVAARLGDLALVAAGHRVVHGGMTFKQPVRVDAGVLDTLETLVGLAPGHEPHNIAAIRAVAAAWPKLPQVACFDTEFHATQPALTRTFALPRSLTEAGVVRYGFHGLSYEYIAGVLPEIAGARAQGRVVVAHLGNGASLCAMQRLQSVATTMGYTALDGLMMGTRSGTIDPGVVLDLIEYQGMTASEVADLLYNRSGLLGVSGISSDVRTLEASADPRAAEALELFAYRAGRELGSLAAALGGLDVLVFTAGIGEHSAAMRRRICERARWLGVEIDAGANERHAQRISAAGSAVEVYVIATNEELVIARATAAMCAR